MSDNIQIVPSEEEKQAVKKRWPLFLGITAVVVLVLFLTLLTQSTMLDNIKRSFEYLWIDDSTVMSFDAYGDCSYALLNGGLTVSSPGGISIFSRTGALVDNIPRSIASPMSISRNDRLFVYDIGGSLALSIDHNGSILQELKSSAEILDGDLANDGTCCVLSSGDGARARAEVYHPDGTLLFRRNSKTEHINTCALSPDGTTLVLTALGQENITFTTTAQIYSISKEDMLYDLSLGNQIIYDMTFLDENTICAVGEHSVIFFRPDGNMISEYSLANGTLKDFCFTGDGYVALGMELYQTDGRFQLILLDGSGQTTQVLPEAPRRLSCSGKYTSVLTANHLLIYDRSATLRDALDSVGAYSSVLVRDDGTALLVASNTAKLFIP